MTIILKATGYGLSYLVQELPKLEKLSKKEVPKDFSKVPIQRSEKSSKVK